MRRCDALQVALGAYVLDGLEQDETREVAEHLRECRRCRGEHDELAATAQLLQLVAEAPPRPSPELEERVLSTATRRPRRRVWLAAAAALAGALLGALAVVGLLDAPESTVQVEVVGVEPFEATSGWAIFRSQDGRVQVRVVLDGLGALPPESSYEAWLSTVDEELEHIGRVHPDGAGAVSTSLQADGPLSRYRSFWITAEPYADLAERHIGPTVVQARLPESR